MLLICPFFHASVRCQDLGRWIGYLTPGTAFTVLSIMHHRFLKILPAVTYGLVVAPL